MSNIEHPSHYVDGRKYEPIDVINDWQLGFNLGNTIKYISRAGRKDDIVQDLNKAKFYLEYEIERLELEREQDKKQKNDTTSKTETKQEKEKYITRVRK